MFGNQTEGCNLTLMEEVKFFYKVAYIPVFVIGLLLNTAALCVFLRKRASWTETHVYMINLAVADFALILFLPVRIYSFFNQLEVWDFCPYLIAVHYLNMYASIFTVAAISVHRLVAVKFPFCARAHGLRKRTAFAICVFLWAVVVTICVLYSKLNSTQELQSCFEIALETIELRFVLVFFILGFFLPFCTILFCSSLTIFSLLKDDHVITHEEKRKCVAIITANLIVFIVCYAPFNIMLLVKFSVAMQSQHISNCATYNLVHNIWSVTKWIATTNCCLDSIAYYFLFKEHFALKLTPDPQHMPVTQISLTYSLANQ
ncbi:G-protein coupled receptor 35 [Anguilla anguilla]|uniref:G-protein coupled receptors family 1 profile domain-containing protein n=1 Tax=Anguilla anguilla TaxID=7936 RepID=A0A9D3MF22_ANGAN|nr:G-protein coupled receptor 35 [Anguilla anguilla]XP_035277595.1 G-protein coupled receptor 35 [Anguilla anguilla]XP_035277597.1 G-protein coupled receptor 35 [Anguilla anguilla]XP_035277598.1 G-protein coupled receptor 35 [Anguilla anguilla]KAG5847801.1 hypothetical protein ANANG_G00130060 [Anguilla anguilla]